MTLESSTTNRRDIERFLRVDHAGERAAQKIYRGQLMVMGNGPMGDEIRHMMDQEVEHLETFDRLLNERQVRPSLLDLSGRSRLYPWHCHRGNWTKGCDGRTIAVEEVIGGITKQANQLGTDEASLRLQLNGSATTSSNTGTSQLITGDAKHG